MQILSPLCITSCLMAGFRFEDGSSISIEYANKPGDDGRTRYHYIIDAGDGREHDQTDLQSGIGRHNLQHGLASLVDFLRMIVPMDMEDGEDGEDTGFPAWVLDWIEDNQNELDDLACILEEQTLIKE